MLLLVLGIIAGLLAVIAVLLWQAKRAVMLVTLAVEHYATEVRAWQELLSAWPSRRETEEERR